MITAMKVKGHFREI